MNLSSSINISALGYLLLTSAGNYNNTQPSSNSANLHEAEDDGCCVTVKDLAPLLPNDSLDLMNSV